MAKVRSTIFASMRGSVAATTYTAMRGNPIVARERVIPIDRASNFQIQVRNSFNDAATMWSLMDPDVRETWISWVKRSGYNMTARSYWMGLYSLCKYMSLNHLGWSVPTTPPVLPGALKWGYFNPMPASTPGQVGFDLCACNHLTYGLKAVVQYQGPYDASRIYPGVPWDPYNTSSDDIPLFSSSLLHIDNLVSDQVYMVRCCAVDGVDFNAKSRYSMFRVIANTVP